MTIDLVRRFVDGAWTYEAITEDSGGVPAPEDAHLVGAVGEPDFEDDWKNVGGGLAPASFYIDDQDRVFTDGYVEDGSAGSTVFTLPVGYRPSFQVILMAWNNNPANGQVRMDIYADGRVVYGGSAPGSFLALSQMHWRAA